MLPKNTKSYQKLPKVTKSYQMLPRAKRLRAKCHPGQNVSGQNVTQPKLIYRFKLDSIFAVKSVKHLLFKNIPFSQMLVWGVGYDKDNDSDYDSDDNDDKEKNDDDDNDNDVDAGMVGAPMV